MSRKAAPPLLGELSPLLVLSNQQHRTTISNSAIPDDAATAVFYSFLGRPRDHRGLTREGGPT